MYTRLIAFGRFLLGFLASPAAIWEAGCELSPLDETM